MKFLRTASKIAWRELHSSPGRFLFVAIAVAVGVGALSGVKGFGAAFRSMLFSNAKQLTASDLSAQVWALPDDKQLHDLRSLAGKTGDLTWVTETFSMAGRTNGGPPQLVTVKAIDPQKYPFYGSLTTSPARPLRELLSNDAVLVNSELLIRLRLHPGDSLRLGGQDFHISGTLITEPDRLASGFGPSMRVLMTRRALDRTGLVKPGSRATQRFLFKLGPRTDMAQLRKRIGQILIRPRITDFRDGDPAIEKGINNSTVFLSLVSLIALIIGALGVGMSMYSHIQQKMDTIAVMKAVGAQSKQIITVYLLQTLWVGLAGGLMGVALGALVQSAFPVLIRTVFDLLPQVAWNWSFSVQGLALGVMATLLFTMPPLLAVRQVKPSLVFRREMEEVKQQKGRWREFLMPSLAAAVVLAGIAAIAVWLSNSWQMGFYFVAGVAVSLTVLMLAAALLLRLMRGVVRSSGRRLPSNFRHGFANLYRPGTHSASVLVALGVGVMFTLTTYLIQQIVLRDVNTEAPGRGGNVFLVDISPPQREAVTKFISTQPGVQSPPELIGYFVARMVRKNGVASSMLPLDRRRRDQLQTSRISVLAALPKNFELTAGHLWAPNDPQPRIAISEEQSHRFGVGMGDRLQFQAAGRSFEAPVVATFRPTARGSFRFDLLYPPAAMNGIPAIYYGAVQMKPAQIPAFEQALFERFPTLTVINLADILQRVQAAINQIALVIRFLAGFAILAGVIILSSSVAGTRYRRIREVAILKTFGGTRRRISAIFSIEFTILGAVAGLIGGVLANIFSRFIATKFIETSSQFDWLSVAGAMIGTAVLANIAGWLASARILGQRPLEVLRGE
jgi:putative ABC transport system permease protein